VLFEEPAEEEDAENENQEQVKMMSMTTLTKWLTTLKM
jgi:hypothetical protein